MSFLFAQSNAFILLKTISFWMDLVKADISGAHMSPKFAALCVSKRQAQYISGF